MSRKPATATRRPNVHHPMAPMTLEEVAAALSIDEGKSISAERVRQIEEAALKKLRKHLEKAGWSAEDLFR